MKKSMKNRLFLVLISLYLFMGIKAQDKYVLQGEYVGFLDNREYFNSHNRAQTMFGNRLDLGLQFQVDSIQKVFVGFDYVYEFGAPANAKPIIPTIYYAYKNTNIDFSFGAFPRSGKLDYPHLLLTDTLDYYKPNIEGVLLNLKSNIAHQNVWIDWTGRQSETVNESFLAGTSGNIHKGILFIENYLYMYHHAAKSIRDSLFHIRDNGGGMLLAGLDLRKQYFVKFAVGSAFSYDRYRPNKYQINKGLFAQILFQHSFFGLRLIHYRGDGLSLAYGDGFYSADNYTRIDGEIHFFHQKTIELFLQLSVHVLERDINTSQKLILKIKLPKNSL